ncbi:hypothetical protein BO78DRAFT_421866 [Aspergillus sclerotiicarbonarius CBS 121057]|uniref:UbiA prenyltransferase n=1 Tax=Aspergillus sclerotiicarbonarius (strain CBS 121057 / IBT 28362) TaxID=1448318 RepID=A0A319E0V5_ASPSB|nr:hypothetical protein BO78DRAFT_421866 [Aspergillus sclerotiicarbonarius CBS 121057]
MWNQMTYDSIATHVLRLKDYRASLWQTVLRPLHFIIYHAYTLFLFTYSDFKTIVIPSTIFGLFNSLATTAYGLDDDTPITFFLLLKRMLSTLLWVMLVFIPFAINNQRTPSAIAEDAINKPWRPIPQKRISATEALCFMCFFAFLVQIHGRIHNGLGYRQSSLLLVLNIWYNNLGGADKNPVIRNGINTLGYLCFLSGALEVALEKRIPFFLHIFLGHTGYRLDQWLLIIAGVLFSTVHLQDLYDQEGDAVRGRRTLPLVIGDGPARWTVAIPMLFWGVACPSFWGLRGGLFSLSLGLACLIAWRVLTVRHEEGDRATFFLWNCWISMIYIMPLIAEWR